MPDQQESYHSDEENRPKLSSVSALVKSPVPVYRKPYTPWEQAMDVPDLIYKIATMSSYAPSRLSGSYAGMPIDATDGYMHFSTAAQLRETLRLHFRNQADLVVLAVRTADLPDLIWEPSRGGQLFPHLYGSPLPLSAVEWEAEVSVDAEGNCDLPEAVR